MKKLEYARGSRKMKVNSINTLAKASVCAALLTLVACADQTAKSTGAKELAAIWPKLDIAVKTDPKVEQRITNIMQDMSLEQKVAQVIQPEIRDITVEDMRRYGFGSYLNGGGSFPQ
ncbi:MAG: beta-glucosidase, partial [Paraglaciecola sp.]